MDNERFSGETSHREEAEAMKQAAASRAPLESMIVYDEEEECPYLDNRIARMPLRFPIQPITLGQADGLLNLGFRRSGRFLYRTNCPGCAACEAIRIDVGQFEPNRSQRRALKKGNGVFDLSLGTPVCTSDRVDLFNKHRNLRGLNRHDKDIDEEEYAMFLVESCLNSFELSYSLDGKLAMVAICDQGIDSLSAVYTFYDPELQRYSPGTYSIMKQLEYCRGQGLRFLYLGYFVEGSPAMSYKRNFLPHERLQAGQWKRFSRNRVDDFAE